MRLSDIDVTTSGLPERPYAPEVGLLGIRLLEKRKSNPTRTTQTVNRVAFENAGVEFIDENGGAGRPTQERRGG